MESKFNVGDRVMCTDNGKYGNVTLVDTSQVGEWGSTWYEVIFDDGEEAYLEEEYLELTDVDKKTAFLNELKELMERYNAMITIMRPTQGNPILALESEDFKVFYTTYPCIYTSITPSNIFDYDKV